MDHNPDWTPRKQTLTEADVALIESIVKRLMNEHYQCRINVTHEEMDDIKRVAKFFNATESVIVKWITKMVLWFGITVVGGVIWLLYNHGYFVKGGK